MSKSKGARVLALRKALKLSQEKFAMDSGMSASALQKIELGYNEASDELLQRISNQWNCPIEWLESGKGEFKFTKATPVPTNVYQDALYKELKEDKVTWQKKYEELWNVFTKLVPMGKLKTLLPAGFFCNKENHSRVGTQN